MLEIKAFYFISFKKTVLIYFRRNTAEDQSLLLAYNRPTSCACSVGYCAFSCASFWAEAVYKTSYNSLYINNLGCMAPVGDQPIFVFAINGSSRR